MDRIFMEEALKEANKAYELKEIPIGAVIVKDGKIIGRGHNLKQTLRDSTLHAEMIAIKEASNTLRGWRLLGCTMYVTLEPCSMCTGALVNARVERVVIATRDYKTGACGSVLNIAQMNSLNHQVIVNFGVLEEKATEILKRFFVELRQSKKNKKLEDTMYKYPVLEINLSKLYNNTKIVTEICSERGISVAGIVKGFGGLIEGAQQMVKGGCIQIGSSRIEQLKDIKDSDDSIPLLLVRIPMACEIEDVVRCSDICLISEKDTLIRLNNEAKKQNKIYKVILMYDLGDLREGVFTRKELIDMSLFIENDLDNIYLEGIGSNLSCYGSIAPTFENLTELSEVAELVEDKLNRKLNIVSGGATTTLPLLIKGGVPNKINHLRLGESIINTQDLPLYWDCNIKGLDPDLFILKAQIVELNEKPTHPIGKLMVNAFGEYGQYEDKGIRKRCIVALGNQDVGDCFKIIPKDKDISILGASSDHTILDINDCKKQYKVGDIIEFNVLYQAMLFSSLSKYVHKKFVK